ncbi:MAG: nucleotidyltransferase family protein, partial [Casimicrobiaceae bacterium]
LHPVDQVLHSASHLFLDSEARDRVRDLVDLDGLFRHFGTRTPFWLELPERARYLGLGEPLFLACHFCVNWLATPIPSDTMAQVAKLGPPALRRAWLLPMIGHILTPTGPDQSPPWRQELAATIFHARHHRNRMPLRLLVRHLLHKLRPRAKAVDAAATAEDA